MMHRREVLRRSTGVVAGALLGGVSSLAAAQPAGRTSMGLVAYCLGFRQRADKQRNPQADLFEPMTFLEHCQKLGAGGIQASLGSREEKYATALRQRAERLGMYLEGIISAPQDKAGLERFEAEVRTAAQAGVRAVRTVIIPGRRYEYFDSLPRFREFAERGRRSLELAEPVVARHRVRLAVENHKDQRLPERLALLKRISSEWVGVCLDTGNSFALMEDPIAVVEAFAPWAFSVHLKDQAVAEYEDGFLLADIPLGQGFLDLKRMVAILQKAKPNICFSLELITRDPLRVPCLTERFWATMPDVPGSDLARTMRLVRQGKAKTLPIISTLSAADQVAREEAFVRDSLTYAREQLGLKG